MGNFQVIFSSMLFLCLLVTCSLKTKTKTKKEGDDVLRNWVEFFSKTDTAGLNASIRNSRMRIKSASLKSGRGGFSPHYPSSWRQQGCVCVWIQGKSWLRIVRTLHVLKAADIVHINNAWALLWCTVSLNTLPKIMTKTFVQETYHLELKTLVNFFKEYSKLRLKRFSL